MRQLLYISIAVDRLSEEQLSEILNRSRHNNALDAVTGLLWSDGKRFMQVIEGPSASIRETYQRIERDERHRDILIVRDRMVSQREFGDWAMCHRLSYETRDEYDRKVSRMLTNVSGSFRLTLGDFLSA